MSGAADLKSVSDLPGQSKRRDAAEVVAHRTGLAGVEAMTLATARSFARHSHDEYGVGVMTFGGHRSWSGLGQVEAFPGDVIAVNPGEIHDGAPIRGEPRGWRMIYVRPEVLVSMVAEDQPAALEFARPAFRDQKAAALFARLFSVLAAGSFDPLAIEERLAALIDRFVAQRGMRPRRPRDLPPPVAKARQRIDDDPAVAISLAELAAIAGVSRFQLLRGFSRHLGVTPHAYLVQRRVRLARESLRAGRTPVEAAAEAGFSDQSHMTRAFACRSGITPARFRAAAVA